MDAMDALFTRRSTRKMKKEPLPRPLIEKVIEAGRMAPSGGNSQTTHFLVLTSPAQLDALADLVQSAFAEMEATENMYRSIQNSIRASKKGGYRYDYGAPVLIVTANQRSYGNAMADSACALENMMIAANALDLGSCWINQLHWLDENSSVRAFLEKLGLGKDETITGGLILGYPDTKDGLPCREPLERTGNKVTWA